MDKKASWHNIEKMLKDEPELLPEFQKFLLARKLVPEKNIRFLAYWVSRFLEFSQKHVMERIHLGEFESKGGGILQRTELTPEQVNILKSLNISPPPKVCKIDLRT